MSAKIQGSFVVHRRKDGVDGTAAKLITLTASGQVIKVGKTGIITPATLIITGVSQETTITSWLYGVDGGALSTTPPAGVTRTNNIVTIMCADVTATTLVIKASDGTYSDSITIVKVTDGSDGITVTNKNESHTLPSSAAGVVSSYTGSGTEIEVWEGETLLEHSDSSSIPGRYTVAATVSPSGKITVGAITDDGGANTTTFVADHSAMNAATDVVVITYLITGKRLDGTAFSTTKTQTLTKSKAGINGANGANGIDAITVEISNQNQIVDADGNDFQSYAYVKVLRGNTYLTPVTEYTVEPTADGLVIVTANDATNKRYECSLEGFTGDTVIVGTVLLSITVGEVVIQRILTVARNNKFIVYPRGNYSATAVYVGNAFRREVVKYNGFHYVTKITAGTITAGTLPTNTTKWEPANNFELIATGLLFAENGYISIQSSNKIVILDAEGNIVGGMSGEGVGADAWRLWVGGSTPSTAAFRVLEDGSLVATKATISGNIEATSGLFGLLKIVGSTIESKALKISDTPISVKSDAIASTGYTIPGLWPPSPYYASLTQAAPSVQYESEEVAIDDDAVFPSVYWGRGRQAGESTPHIYENGSASCTVHMIIEVWNNGVMVGSTDEYRAFVNGTAWAYGSGASISGTILSRGTVKLIARITLTNIVGWNDTDWFKIYPVLTSNSTGAKSNIIITAWVRRTVIGRDGLYSFANQNRYVYFRGANDSNDEFEMNLGGNKIGYKDSTGWNIPGVLVAGCVDYAGAKTNEWGSKKSPTASPKGGTGVFNVPHLAGSVYVAIVVSRIPSLNAKVISQSNNTFQVVMYNGSGVPTDPASGYAFNYVILGAN